MKLPQKAWASFNLSTRDFPEMLFFKLIQAEVLK